MEIPVSHIEMIDGKPVIKGRQLKVKMVAGMYIKAGASIEAIMEQYNLTAAEVHAALAYYYDNQAMFEQEERAKQPLIDAAREESEKRLARMRAQSDE